MPAPATAALQHLGSSLRVCSAEHTWAVASRWMTALGISRVTDVTRLDRLGLPVFASIRPRGQALCVHAGKGLGAAEARTGALMEALEFAVAEPQRSPWQGRSLRIGALLDDWDGAFGLADLAPRFGMPLPADRLLHTVRCEDVAGGTAAWLPAELVFMPYDDPHGPVLFGWSSNGLASGNTLAEATLHGLLEVLERDALLMNLPCDRSAWITPGDYPAPFGELADAWLRIGVTLVVRQVPNAFGLPCFQALLAEDSRDQPVDLAGGSGLHLDSGIAFTRAVCEAAQSRLSTIHGGRDDVSTFYAHRDADGGGRDASQSLAWQEAGDRSRQIAWRDLPGLAIDDRGVDALLSALLQRLRERGFAKVLRHRFDIALDGLQVVKIIVPGCQEADMPLERAGRRLLELGRGRG